MPYNFPTPPMTPEPPQLRADLADGEHDGGVLFGELMLEGDLTQLEDTGWFYSERWQAGERQVDELIKAAQVQRFKSAAALLGDLHRRAAEREQGGSR